MGLAIAAFVVIIPAAASGQTLPSDWVTASIGTTVALGSARATTCASSADCLGFSMRTLGTSFGAPDEQFLFTGRPMLGDGDIVALVKDVPLTTPDAKVGVIIRDSLAPSAAQAALTLTASGSVGFHRRRDAAGITALSSVRPPSGDVWVLLQRRSNTVTASFSVDGTTWTLIGSDTITLGASAYVGIAATSGTMAGAITAYVTDVELQEALPAPWSAIDLAGPQRDSRSGYAPDAFVMRSSGLDVGDVADDARYTYRAFSGDVDLIARVASLRQGGTPSKAGIMIRTSPDVDAAHVSALLSSAAAVGLVSRPADGLPTVQSWSAPGTMPAWLKLERRGDAISAFSSTDGATWQMVGSQSLSLPSTFYVGMVASSHDTLNAAVATFDNVSATLVLPNVLPAVSAASPVVTVAADGSRSVTLQASASDADGTVTSVAFYVDGVLVGAPSTAPYTVTTTIAPGTHSVIATAQDNRGGTASTAAIPFVVPSNVWTATFVPSTDHATLVINYVIEIYAGSVNATALVATKDIGKPAIVAGECTADLTATIGALPKGTYVAVIKAIGYGGTTVSTPSASFVM